jgi:hypothetical protein
MAQHEQRVAQSEQRAAAESARLEAIMHQHAASVASASASAPPTAPPTAASSLNDEEKASLLARLNACEAAQTFQQGIIAKRAHYCRLSMSGSCFRFSPNFSHLVSLYVPRSLRFSVTADLATSQRHHVETEKQLQTLKAAVAKAAADAAAAAATAAAAPLPALAAPPSIPALPLGGMNAKTGGSNSVDTNIGSSSSRGGNLSMASADAAAAAGAAASAAVAETTKALRELRAHVDSCVEKMDGRLSTYVRKCRCRVIFFWRNHLMLLWYKFEK